MTNPQYVEELARLLHGDYRATFKALHERGVGPHGTAGCSNEHDHGWNKCHRKAYFLRRAKAMLIGRIQ